MGKACEFILVQMLIYLATYAVAILAVCLTGNIVIGVLGSAVLLLYSYILEFLKHELMYKFFETYYGSEYALKIWAFSPVHLMLDMINEGEEKGYTGYYVKLAIMAIIFGIGHIYVSYANYKELGAVSV